ncbi:MmcQ/YjbR family DNA-binding protein [Furfurilactobacillus rossiae]|uniref:MmcQ/YjbR family DNA-binding protein n=1 Tax=Furfurilactobacillus rossiae DSM 15814 TaxID=1114972 RepID=A0A0R1RV03_9LACO|nr:MmcQ/YjbR family DNA-binding protein [Furfurilactobacillus rossiae]KRL56939.1 hypothetical protein FD35_GL001235 [Furfurilactobacillus rossiae DSM 15814]MCF6166234.1 MmcQ/YjbR family DNA-binding protein [Furfurilactobacillus rossiae]QFR67031.1 MmcQ/YjbR family DNA-binding protein [Furfurilactobacillus rossiae]QLE62536.1 hypothetical protein LROSRS0_2492 [Furfurilactobacillus rossiae]QLE65256.1 hypothetical protein LROSL1_2456 [Furfurilactobacillus rossiae]
MTEKELIQIVIDETGGFLDHPFNGGSSHEKINWNIIRHHRNRKILAMVFIKDDHLLINLKLSPEHGEFARKLRGVEPGYHMNKTHWNTIDVNHCDVQPQELVGMIRESSALTEK